jgi:hypothetical protein
MTNTFSRTFSILAAAAATLAMLPSSAAQAAPADQATPTTHLTLDIADCEGCEVAVASYLRDSETIWDSAKPKVVTDGSVTFKVPTDRTAGLSITVRAPWEGATGYVTNVALRYKGTQPGDKVGFTLARASTRASGCWAGTTADTATMKVVVRKVQVEGYGGKVAGTLAYAKVTQDWLRPLVRTWHGVVGTQDLMPCRG